MVALVLFSRGMGSFTSIVSDFFPDLEGGVAVMCKERNGKNQDTRGETH